MMIWNCLKKVYNIINKTVFGIKKVLLCNHLFNELKFVAVISHKFRIKIIYVKKK